MPELVVFQRVVTHGFDVMAPRAEMLEILGLVTLGPTDTVGDGECMYRALSQQLKTFTPEYGTIWGLQHTMLAQKGFQQLRQDAADEISSSSSFKTLNSCLAVAPEALNAEPS